MKDLREPEGAPQVPPLRSPGFPVETRGVDVFHAALSMEAAHVVVASTAK